jgi:TolA-binding protein
MQLPQLRSSIVDLQKQINTLQGQLMTLQQQESLQTQEELDRAVNNLNHYFHLPSQMSLPPPIWRINDRSLVLGYPMNRFVRRDYPQYRLSAVPQETWLADLENALASMGLSDEQRALVFNALQGVGTNVVSISDANAIHQLAM